RPSGGLPGRAPRQRPQAQPRPGRPEVGQAGVPSGSACLFSSSPWRTNLTTVTPRTDRRPNPDELLRRVQAEERRERRGRLKIFLGYAPRVGKSLRMFDEGRRRKERGQDVVIAAAQNEVPGAVREIVSHLE